MSKHEQQLLNEEHEKGHAVYGDSSSYKQQVENAKQKLRRQILILVALSFLLSLAIFLSFYFILN